MFKKHPEKYRGPAVYILSVIIILLIAVQFYFTTIPCIPLENAKKETTEIYSMTDFMYTETYDITRLLQKIFKDNYFSINPYADMIAFANGLGIAVVVMSLISLKCFATHIVSMVWAFWAPYHWMTNKIWELATEPVAKTIYTVTQVTLFLGAALVIARTVIYLVYRFVIPFFKWRKATAEWRVEYEAALAAEAAEKAGAEAATN